MNDLNGCGIVLVKEDQNGVLNPGGVSCYEQCPFKNRWKMTEFEFE